MSEESVAAKTRRRVKRLKEIFNITPEEYDAILAAEGGCCPICQQPYRKDGKPKLLNVDHRHSDGLIRGILCAACNRALSVFAETPVLFERAAKYLRQPPAVAAIGPRYGLPGRVNTKKQRKLLKKIKKLRQLSKQQNSVVLSKVGEKL